MDFFKYRESGGKGMKKPMDRRTGRRKRWITAIAGTMVAVCLAAAWFLRFWKPFGGTPSKEMQAEFEKRTELFYDGTFHTEGEFRLLVEPTTGKENTREAEKLRPEGRIPVTKITGLPEAAESDLKMTWFGHSTVLLQIGGKTVFIDPVLSRRCSPVGFAGPERMAEVPMEAEDVPEIDLLLLSHDHYDHLDYETIRKIDSKVRAYGVPLGVESHLIRWGVAPEKIQSFAWWDEMELDGLKVAAAPGQHYTARLPWKRNRTWWCGYILQSGDYNVYYTGDTGFDDFFYDIYERYGAMDLVIMENGQYNEKWPDTHMQPSEGVEAAKILEAAWVLPVHWAGFVLSEHGWSEPAEDYTALAEQEGIQVVTPKIGETADYREMDKYREKWWRSVE